MMQTKLTKLLGIDYPIIQSGMQWLAVPQFRQGAGEELFCHGLYFKRIRGFGYRIEIPFGEFGGVWREIDIAQTDLALLERGQGRRDARFHALTVVQLAIQQCHGVDSLPAITVIDHHRALDGTVLDRTDVRES